MLEVARQSKVNRPHGLVDLILWQLYACPYRPEECIYIQGSGVFRDVLNSTRFVPVNEWLPCKSTSPLPFRMEQWHTIVLLKMLSTRAEMMLIAYRMCSICSLKWDRGVSERFRRRQYVYLSFRILSMRSSNRIMTQSKITYQDLNVIRLDLLKCPCLGLPQGLTDPTMAWVCCPAFATSTSSSASQD